MSAPSTSSSRPCPVCRKPRDHALRQRSDSVVENPHAPFCSKACKDRDLLRWFSDSYAVPGPPVDPEDGLREESD
jgi:uncharacterized protein